MGGVRAGRVLKLRSARRARGRPVVRMMAIMQDGSGNNEELPKEFVEGGRTGRRNAMPDILHPPDAHASTADLPSRLQQLATTVYVSTQLNRALENLNDTLDDIAENSDDLLIKFLGSEQSARRHALPQIPRIDCHEIATNVDSTELFTYQLEDGDLSMFNENIGSDIFGAQSAILDTMMTITGAPYRRDEETFVSDTSLKYCCSEERLRGFLMSGCSKRRNAIPKVTIPVATNVSSTFTRHNWNDTHNTLYPSSSPVPDVGQRAIVSRLCDVILLDDRTLRNMLDDPNNPQPGPSTQPDDTAKETQKKESGS